MSPEVKEKNYFFPAQVEQGKCIIIFFLHEDYFPVYAIFFSLKHSDSFGSFILLKKNDLLIF